MAVKKTLPGPCPADAVGIVLIVFLFLTFAFVPEALAHKVYIFAWVEGDTVFTESYFSGTRKPVSGKIRVFDPSGKQLLEGENGDTGEFSFIPIQKTDLKIVLEASMGHRAEFLLKAEEFGEVAERIEAPAAEASSPVSQAQPVPVELAMIKQIVEEAVEEKLKPVTRALAGLQKEKGPGPTEIIGGIGYIIGLMGIAIYFKGKKKN